MLRTNLLRYILTMLVATAAGAPVVHAQHYSNGPAFMMPPGGGNGHAGCQVPGAQCPPPTVDYYVGQHQPLWDSGHPIEQALTSVAQRSWLRFDYLHWEFEGPKDRNLGAPVTGDTTPTFAVNDIETPTTQRGQGYIPQAGGLGLQDISGVRGTLGVALNGGSLELSVFGTEQTSSSFSLTNLQAGRDPNNVPPLASILQVGTTSFPNVITPLLSNGVVADASAVNALVYDQGFQASLDAQMWGSELLVLSDPYVPGYGVKWQLLGGFQYLSYDESFNQTGVFTDGGQIAPRITSIGGNTINNIYGPEIGARVSLKAPRMTFSATPRIAFSLNDHTSTTVSGPLTTTDLAVTRITAEDIDFSPLIQVSFLGEFHCSPHLSLFAGYDFMWITQLSRVNENIVYNSVPGVAGDSIPVIEQDVDLTSLWTQGLSVGAVLRY